MKPTEGEWRTEAVSDAVRIVVGTGKKKIILARLCPPQIPEKETATNARLMAASKRLLSVLKHHVNELIRLGRVPVAGMDLVKELESGEEG